MVNLNKGVLIFGALLLLVSCGENENQKIEKAAEKTAAKNLRDTQGVKYINKSTQFRGEDSG